MVEALLSVGSVLTGIIVTHFFNNKRDKNRFDNELKLKEIEEEKAIKRKESESKIEYQYRLKEKNIEVQNEHSYFTKKFMFEIKYPIYQELYATYKNLLGVLIVLNSDRIEPSEADMESINFNVFEREVFLNYMNEDQLQIEYYNYYINKFCILKREVNNIISKNNLIFNKHENTIFFNCFEELIKVENYILDNIKMLQEQKETKALNYQKIFINNATYYSHFRKLDNYMYGIAELFKITLGLYWEEKDKPLSIEEVYRNLGITQDTQQ